MAEQTDILQALDCLNPAALDYSQWAMVGMALKESGYPLQYWEDWSRRDAARYHPGECARKWESFRGSAQPVTAASIFELACQHGFSGGGHALDWDSEITGDGALLSPAWVEDRELRIPEHWAPADQLIRYLQALFEPSENVGYITASWNKDGRWVPQNSGCWDRTAGELIQALAQCGGDIGAVLGDYHKEAGAWIRFNPLDGNGCCNRNVTDYRYALVECDELELEKQNALIRELELPCAALVYSGKKSLHAIVRIDAADSAEYKRRVEYLYGVCKKNGLALDEQNKNPSRLSRMPGVERAGQKQYLLDTNIGKASFSEWREWIEASADDLPGTENIAAVWDDLPPLAEPLIEGVLRQGHKLLLAGPSKAGKSFALIELCIAIAEGTRWLGRFACAKGRVLYINLELDRASCLHRFRDVYEALGIPPKNLANIDLWNLRGASVPMDKLAPKLIRRAAKKGYMAIVLDPIYKVITGDENSADQMAKFCNQFDLVCRELGCAVIYCHHHSKGAQGAKRSMDRASGSGVFARDPDALLDLIELELTDAIREHQEKNAVCRVCRQYLEQAGKLDEVSQDEQLSAVQMSAACKKHLDPARQAALAAALAAAKQQAAGMTAWRIEGTLREFARFAPVDLWFDYPVHRPDESGVLGDIQPDSEFASYGKRGSGKRWKKPAAERREDRTAAFDTAYAACASMGDKVTVYSLAEYMGVSQKTVRNRLAENGKYWLDGEKIGRKAVE